MYHMSAYDHIILIRTYTGNQHTVHTAYMSLANQIDSQVVNGPEKSVAMRKLLESLDAAMRASG